MSVKTLILDLANNPYFGAGFGLFGLGLITQLSRYGFKLGTVWLRRHFITSLEVTSQDVCYPWLLQYISEHSKSLQYAVASDGHTLVPATGTHIFRDQNGRYMKAERTREKIQPLGGKPFETLKLVAYGKSNYLFSTLLQELYQKSIDASYRVQIVFTPYLNNEWRQFGPPRIKRSIDSVVLKPGQLNEIVRDLNKFLSSREWYTKTGVPYRRGYLFHGPPGCGKSSLISALAATLNRSICCLNLNEKTMTDERFNQLINNTPDDTVVSLEDIDSIVDQTTSKDVRYSGMAPLSLNGVLNALDGVSSATNGRIVFMTTNHYDRLPSVLIRPGRVDYCTEISHATPDQICTMIRRFYVNITDDQMSAVDEIFNKYKLIISPAELQAQFMVHSNAYDALRTIEKKIIDKSVLK